MDVCINLELQTVGQTSWNIIGQIEKGLIPQNSSGGTGVNSSNYSFTNWVSTSKFKIRTILVKQKR